MFKWLSRSSKTALAPRPAPEQSAPAVGTAEDSTAALSKTIGAALQHHQNGRLADAEAGYRAALVVDPDNIDALHFLGVIAYQRNEFERAVGLISKALSRDFRNLHAQINLGNVFSALDRTDEAIACYRKATEIAPALVDAHVILGDRLYASGDPVEAAASYRRAVVLSPELFGVHFNLGNILLARHELSEAIACYRKAIEIKPGYFEAWSNLGNALLGSERRDEAESCYRKAISINPDFAEAHNNLGDIFKAKGLLDEAIVSFQRAIKLKPNFADAHFHLGNVLLDQDKVYEAAGSYETAISLRPEYAEARWARVAAHLPAVYETSEESDVHRTAFANSLDNLIQWFDADIRSTELVDVRIQTPFYLTYQEQNNRELLQRHGSLCTRLMADWLRQQNFAERADPIPDARIRVGIVSKHFWRHSVWEAIIKGWFQNLDLARVSLHAFYLGFDQDDETRLAKSKATKFVQGSHDLRQWAEIIATEKLDVLVYPEIGMDSLTGRLACLRLAPVQVTTWGQPQTSGLSTMDYFLSAELLEPADTTESYTERLEVLPNLGCFFDYDETIGTQPDFAVLGIDPELPFMLCPGTPFKYAPQNDAVFVKIAQRLGRCQFVFFIYEGSPNMTAKLRRRLQVEFARSDLDFDAFAVFLPWQTRKGFLGLLGRADVYLDTIGFSGFNTAMQAIERDLPIVTRDGRFLRGRLASGILKRIGLHELVAQSEDEYVAIAAKLVEDTQYRKQIVERIRSNRHILFKDEAPIRALEAFLERTIATSRKGDRSSSTGSRIPIEKT